MTDALVQQPGVRESVIRSKLECILRDFAPPELISPDASLVNDLGIDSVAMLRLIVEVEQAFDVVIGGREIEENVLESYSSLFHFLVSQ